VPIPAKLIAQLDVVVDLAVEDENQSAAGSSAWRRRVDVPFLVEYQRLRATFAQVEDTKSAVSERDLPGIIKLADPEAGGIGAAMCERVASRD
jgi:hypothetical protein